MLLIKLLSDTEINKGREQGSTFMRISNQAYLVSL